MKTRNYMVPAMIGRYRNTGTRLHDRRMPRGGDRNVQAEFMEDAWAEGIDDWMDRVNEFALMIEEEV